ncbi:MAG: restriction endonuclease [Treponema sp.]|jgi:5-methylcytosine-specific restriction endonuclease McrBC regulatory subunit McrC|nr:restriction endonuclease [Treponema sp.]
MRTTDNNCGKSLSEIGGEYSDDLAAIANKSLIDLQRDNPDLLVFPQTLGQYNDDVEKHHIFSLSDDKLTTYNLMGFVGRNDTRLTISSRFARDDTHDYFLHYMLCKVLSLNIVNLKHSADSEGIQDFLPYLFPAYLKKALSQGMFKQYRRNEYNDANVRGVIDVPRHINRNIPFAGNIAYNTREYSYDNDMTELVRHTIEHLGTVPVGNAVLTCDPDTRADVQKITNAAPSYNKNDRRKIINANRKPLRHPYFTEYLPLQRLCLQILMYEKMSFGQDKDKVYGLLFDGAWLWEEYLNTILKKDFDHPRNKTREGGCYLFENFQRIYPDFISKSDNPKIVADAKYIPLSGNREYEEESERAASIYYKTIMYMYRFSSHNGYLFYPYSGTEKKEPETYKVKDTEGTLTKLGLAIPQQANNFMAFCTAIEKHEKEFVECSRFRGRARNDAPRPPTRRFRASC